MSSVLALGKRTAEDALLPTVNSRPLKRSSQESDSDVEDASTWAFPALLGSLANTALKILNLGGDTDKLTDATNTALTNVSSGIKDSLDAASTAVEEMLPPALASKPPTASTPDLSSSSTPQPSPQHSRVLPSTRKPLGQSSIPSPLSLEQSIAPESPYSRVNGGPSFVSVASPRSPFIRSGAPPPNEREGMPTASSFDPWSMRKSQSFSLTSSRASSLSTSNLGHAESTPNSRRNDLYRTGSLSSNGPPSARTSVTSHGSLSSSTGGVFKAYGRQRQREHIHAKLNRQNVQEVMQRELFELQRSRGYKQDYDTFRDFLLYRERIEALEQQDVLLTGASRSLSHLRTQSSPFSSSLNRSTSSILSNKSSGSNIFASSVRSSPSSSSISRSPLSASFSVRSGSSSPITPARIGITTGILASVVSPIFVPKGLSNDQSASAASPAYLKKAIERAKSALSAPRPPRPNISEFEKLRLDDKERDAEIERRLRGKKKLPTVLPPKILAQVNEIFDTKRFLVTLDRQQVAAGDVQRLLPGTWLNDEIINYWGVMLMQRAERYKAGKGKEKLDGDDAELGRIGKKEPLQEIHCFNTFFFSKLESPGYEQARLNKWTKKIDVFKKDIIIIPVNRGNAHWACAAINFKKRRIEYYDSLGACPPIIYSHLRDYLDREHRDKKKRPFDFQDWVDWWDENTPQQENAYDCGVFTCLCMEALSRGEEASEFNYEQSNMPYLRQRMVWEIKQQRIP
ncbi:Smt3-specific protease [Tulasnella sp. 419]|nr:Smt3-specific protease [Tulasnella sp. 419]